MRITESKLRKMIRSVIREFTTSATAAGAEKKGYKSKAQKDAQADYDAKVSDYDTKDADYRTKRSDADLTFRNLANFADKKYKSVNKGGTSTNYSSTNTAPRSLGFGPWQLNPDWTTKDNEASDAGVARDAAATVLDTARSAKTTAKSTLDTKKAADLEKEIPKEKPPAGGGGFGKGKTSGKGKGKGKGKKKD